MPVWPVSLALLTIVPSLTQHFVMYKHQGWIPFQLHHSVFVVTCFFMSRNICYLSLCGFLQLILSSGLFLLCVNEFFLSSPLYGLISQLSHIGTCFSARVSAGEALQCISFTGHCS